MSATKVTQVSRETLAGEALARMRALSQQDRQMMASVHATRALLEPLNDTAHTGTTRAAAGLVIVIGAQQQTPQIELVASPVLPSDDTESK
jgi:hypothetical protein